ncbi:hypothetical protein RDWZM_001013 [Blomia tropicalis]|uniref:receptor protein serine/threonine kinase n=1 Tax=Blomia tropicalis TaxID=40697 RepID=A0A9Q0M9X0_BLOTA|nr:hypothetical protein RDWZM_001013 [Blomia tropicalis]
MKANKCICSSCPNEDTCQLEKGGFCFTHVRIIENDYQFEQVDNHGCLPPFPDLRTLFMCRSNLSNSELPQRVLCCQDEDFCNSIESTPWFDDSFFTDANQTESDSSFKLTMFGGSNFITTINSKSVFDSKKNFVISQKSAHGNSRSRSVKKECESSSRMDSGLHRLAEKTLAMDVHLEKVIGSGRYGEVWLGNYKGEKVSVKIFLSHQENSFFRELEIYSSFLTINNNILRFIGADITSKNHTTELILVTEYIEYGSMYDYLENNPLTNIRQMLSLMNSLANGICYLHEEINSVICPKVPISHRDIKSKNVLMRSNFTCCISDFGLSLKKTHKINKETYNYRVGTKRYMPPEILSQTLEVDSFESFLFADIYSLGLVFWELFNCLRFNESRNFHQIPFHDLVSNDPSYEEMNDVVCIKKKRPNFDQQFLLNNPDYLVSIQNPHKFD